MALAVALFAALVVGFIAFSAGFGRAFLTAPILFMVAGVLVGRIEAFAAIDHACPSPSSGWCRSRCVCSARGCVHRACCSSAGSGLAAWPLWCSH